MLHRANKRTVINKGMQLAKESKPGQNPIAVVKVDRTREEWERVMRGARRKAAGSLAIRFE